jgi:Brp/Blh family beta-carotene 15,15'-monooxygenase
MRTFFAWEPLSPPGSARRPLPPAAIIRYATVGAVGFLGAGVILSFAGLAEGGIGLVPLALSALLFGLPHGAVDHLVVLGLARRSLRLPTLLAVTGVYLAVVLLALLVWWIAPVVAVLGFLGLTIAHWGQADAAFDRLYRPTGGLTAAPAGYWIDALLRGLLPIGIPFVAFPGATASFLEACYRLFSAQPPPDFKEAGTGVLVVLIILWLAHAALHLTAFYHQRNRQHLHILAESAALTGFFVLVPPVAAIGWYFCGWHGLRHVLRLCTYEPRPVVSAAGGRANLGRFFLQATPFTIAALAMLAGLRFIVLAPDSSPIDQVAAYLVLISALTVPHAIVVAWMDGREGIWLRPGGDPKA